MINTHTVYCILGRTSSGKSTITRLAAKELNMVVLKSYTTRDKRKGEELDSDHIFILEKEKNLYIKDAIACTERSGDCNFMTRQQLLNSDFCIINPSGYYELKLKTVNDHIKLVPIYITVPFRVIEQRARKRGDYKQWKQNYIKESQEFFDFEKSNLIDYRILNDTSIEDAVNKLIKIIQKDKNKEN